MGSRVYFLIAMIVAVIVAPALATNYIVGDDNGWKVGVNYTQWAAGKDFRVNDTLMFVYQPGAHNVLKVNGTDFQQCASSNGSNVPFTSGNDTITLSAPGKKWYICGVPGHCSMGMKLVITVSGEAPAPTPTPWPFPPFMPSPAPTPMPLPTPAPGSSDAREISPLKSCVLMLALMAAYRMIMA